MTEGRPPDDCEGGSNYESRDAGDVFNEYMEESTEFLWDKREEQQAGREAFYREFEREYLRDERQYRRQV